MRRMLMLLLAVMLMVIALAIPAMAVDVEQNEDGSWPTITTCECGAPEGKDENGNLIHVEGCPKEPVTWKPFIVEEGATSVLLPKTGNYYLTDDVEITARRAIGNYDGTAVTVRLDLNGYDVTCGSKATNVYAAYTSVSGQKVTNATLVITDSSAGNGSITQANTCSQGSIFWAPYDGNTLVLYGGTLDGSQASVSGTGLAYHGATVSFDRGGTFIMNGGVLKGNTNPNIETPYPTCGTVYLLKGTFTMNGGEIWGGNVQGRTRTGYATYNNGRGGAVTLDGTTTATINGGIIHGGNCMTGTNTNNTDDTADDVQVPGLGGAIYLKAGTLTINSGATITGGTVSGDGGAIYMAGGTLTINGGLITGGNASGNGGNIYTSQTALIVMNGGTVTEGQAGDQGGNVYTAGYFKYDYGTISLGQAASYGGNVAAHRYAEKTSQFYGVTIEGGTSGTNKGSNVAFFDHMNGATTNRSLAFSTSGTASNLGVRGTIRNPRNGGSSVYVCTCADADTAPQTIITMKDQTILGGIELECNTVEGAATQPSITMNISGDSVIGGRPTEIGDGEINIVITSAVKAKVNDFYAFYTTVRVATAEASEDDIVTVMQTASSQTISKSCNLDLNGFALTGLKIAEGAEINLFNSSAINYVAGTGYVTLAEGEANPFNREMRTTDNKRFVTIAETDAEGKVTQYSAHRLFMTVRSTVLYPKTSKEKVALGYRIAMRCDDTLASYLSAYGLKVSDGEENVFAPVSGWSGKGADNDNSKVVAMTFGTDTVLGETEFAGYAYLTINDGFGSDNTLTSGAVETSLKKEVESAFTKYNTLNETLKANLDWMVETYSTVMSGWAITPPAVNEEN